MSQSEPNATLNGQPGSLRDEKAYQELQEKIHHEIQTIELILVDYYKKNFPRYFHDGMDRSILKWNIVEKGEFSQLEVFFKRHPKTPYGDHREGAEAKHAAAPAEAPAPVFREMARVQPATTDINTYDEVGTPPSGPVPKNN